MKKYTFIVSCCCIFATILGCGKPADLPKLAPFQITVTKKGEPAEGVNVNISGESLPTSYDCYGVTNSSGVAKITVFYRAKNKKFAGAPVGNVKLGFSRSDSYGMEDPQEASKGLSREEAYAYAAERSKRAAENAGYVPIPLSDPMISPVAFTIVAGQNNQFTIELDDAKWDVEVDPRRLQGIPGGGVLENQAH